MTEVTWYATKTAGMFRRGQHYRRDQLGVLGRMAIKAGVLIPVEEATRRVKKASGGAVRPRSAVRARRGKGATDGEATVSSRGGQDVRDEGGPQVGQADDGGSQPGSQA